MLLKPSEIEYIEITSTILEEENLKLDEENNQEEVTEVEDDSPFIIGKTILIGANQEPTLIDENEFFTLFDENDIQEEYEFEMINEPVVIGETEPLYDNYQDSYESEITSDLDLDSEFNIDTNDDFYSDLDTNIAYDIEDSIDIGDEKSENWEKTKHKTLIGKVDVKLFDKIKEYRKNVKEISDEKLSALASNEDMARLLEEASHIIDDIAPTRDINQLISDIDAKIEKFLKKHSEYKREELWKKRENMLLEVEKEIEARINKDLEIIQQEAEQYIDETIQYYKKKLESDNQVISTANNIIKRREQILDEAYEKSLKIVEEAEEKARRIIESSAYAQDEAAAIIAEYEQKGEEIKKEAELEAERIISDANIESARIIQAAEDQYQDIVEASTQDGFNVGYQEGKEEAIKENSELLKEALNALNKLYAALPVAVYQNEEKIMKLAYQVSESVLSESVTKRDEAAQKFIAKSLKTISDLGTVKITVNPQDLDNVLPKQDYFKALLPDVPEFIINSSNTINKGNCSISTNSEKYNISINTQLSILDALFQEISENSN
ncbi:MAG: hypothetical protein KatS3mg068_0590 [Candidatus Sericytochromatia bacterium]|nr:MAG: hypothetical protein KatS3mg068_0590 [Candidatus Sericytochromatia bacterium]